MQVSWVILSLFFLGKKALASLTTYYSGRKPPFPTRLSQWVKAFMLRPARFCNLLAGLSSTNRSATFLPLSTNQIIALSLQHFRPSIYLLFGTSGRNSFFIPSLFLTSCSGFRVIRFFRMMTPAMSWPEKVRGLTIYSPMYYLLLSFPFTLRLSRTGDVLSHLNSSIHKFPQYPQRNLFSLVTLVISSVVFVAKYTAFC